MGLRRVLAAWRWLVHRYQALAATRWGYNLLGRALPSAFFLIGFLEGLDRIPALLAPLAEPTLTNLLVVVQRLVALFTGLCVVVLFAIRKRPVGRPASLLGVFVAFSATFYGSYLIFFSAIGIRPPPPQPNSIASGVGAAVGVASVWLLAVSFLFLGRNFGILPEARGLVTSGPYRYLRHPIYIAYLAGAGSDALARLSMEALAIYLAYYFLVTWRAALEERALEEEFGEDYRRYQRRALGLAPRWLNALLAPRRITSPATSPAR